MKVYILIRNEYNRNEFNNDYIECVYTSNELAEKDKPENFYDNWGTEITYRIEEHEVKQ